MPDVERPDAQVPRRHSAPVPAAPSRRSMLRAAAGAGAAGVAASALTSIAVTAPAAAGAHAAHQAVADPAEPIVVHVRDAAAGQIDVFRGTHLTSLRDRDLAARIVRASR